MITHTMPLVGSHFHPPAKAIIEHLPAGAPLILRPEPDNMFDPGKAVMVMVASSVVASLPAATQAKLDAVAALFGSGLAEILGAPEWHLGYLPAKLNAGLAQAMGYADWPAQLAFAANGAAQVTFDLTPTQQAPTP